MLETVSPSDDDLLDLAECINEKGPGPTSNSRRFQGLPTLIMRGEHGHRSVPCDPRQVTRVEVQQPPLPLPPPLQGKLGRHPPPPSRGHTPPPSKLLIWDQPRKNLTSASKSGSGVTVLTQDDRGEHFWLNSTSLRGQAAELVTSAE
jgi:hypothetical protein